MRSMNQMSLAAYFTKVEPELNERQSQVMEVIEINYPTTLEQISNKLKMPEHAISGRLTELKQKGLIKPMGRTMNSRGSTVNRYAPVQTEKEYTHE